MPRAARFVAARGPRGFTASFLEPRCLPPRHGVGTLPLVRPFASGSALQPSHRLLRPLLTSRSGSTPSPFRAQGEISPGKNALLHCTTAGFTPLPLDHESFAVSGPLALVRNAFYPVLVHRPAASLHASFPHSVALMQLRFTSLVVINSRWDLHPQECAHAGRTKKIRRAGGARRISSTSFRIEAGGPSQGEVPGRARATIIDPAWQPKGELVHKVRAQPKRPCRGAGIFTQGRLGWRLLSFGSGARTKNPAR